MTTTPPPPTPTSGSSTTNPSLADSTAMDTLVYRLWRTHSTLDLSSLTNLSFPQQCAYLSYPLSDWRSFARDREEVTRANELSSNLDLSNHTPINKCVKRSFSLDGCSTYAPVDNSRGTAIDLCFAVASGARDVYSYLEMHGTDDPNGNSAPDMEEVVEGVMNESSPLFRRWLRTFWIVTLDGPMRKYGRCAQAEHTDLSHEVQLLKRRERFEKLYDPSAFVPESSGLGSSRKHGAPKRSHRSSTPRVDRMEQKKKDSARKHARERKFRCGAQMDTRLSNHEVKLSLRFEKMDVIHEEAIHEVVVTPREVAPLHKNIENQKAQGFLRRAISSVVSFFRKPQKQIPLMRRHWIRNPLYEPKAKIVSAPQCGACLPETSSARCAEPQMFGVDLDLVGALKELNATALQFAGGVNINHNVPGLSAVTEFLANVNNMMKNGASVETDLLICLFLISHYYNVHVCLYSPHPLTQSVVAFCLLYLGVYRATSVVSMCHEKLRALVASGSPQGGEDLVIDAVLTVYHVLAFSKLPESGRLSGFIRQVGDFKKSRDGLKSFVSWCVGLGQKFVDYCVSCGLMDAYSLTTDPFPQVGEFVKEASELYLDFVAGSRELTYENGKEVLRVFQKGVKIQQTLPRHSDFKEVNGAMLTALASIRPLIVRLERNGIIGAGPRVAPLAILTYGPSGVGKSVESERTCVALMARVLPEDRLKAFEENTNAFIYNRLEDKEFWDSYNGQFCVKWDDLFQIREYPGMVPHPGVEIVHAVNSNNFHLNFSAVEDKSTHHFTSALVYATTNVSNFRFQTLTSNEAFCRRWMGWIQYASKEFALNPEADIEQRRVDWSRVSPGMTAHVRFRRWNLEEGKAFGAEYTWEERLDVLTAAFHESQRQGKDLLAELNDVKAKYIKERCASAQAGGDDVVPGEETVRKFFLPQAVRRCLTIFEDHWTTSMGLSSFVEPLDLAGLLCTFGDGALSVAEAREFLRRVCEHAVEFRADLFPADKTSSPVYLNFLRALPCVGDERTELPSERFAACLRALEKAWAWRVKNGYYLNGHFLVDLARFVRGSSSGVLSAVKCSLASVVSEMLTLGGTLGATLSGYVLDRVRRLDTIPPRVLRLFSDLSAVDVLKKILLGGAFVGLSINLIMLARNFLYREPESHVGGQRRGARPHNRRIQHIVAKPAHKVEQMNSDLSSFQIAKRIATRSTYKITLPTGQSLGYVTFVKGCLAVTPIHICDYLVEYEEKGGKVMQLTRIGGNNQMLEVALSEISYHDFDEDEDIGYLKFPSYVPAHPDISKYFVDEDDLKDINRRDVLLVLARTVSNLEFYASPATPILNQSYGNYFNRHGWIYPITTYKGDCGGLLYLLDKTTGARKILGFHTAHIDDRGYSAQFIPSRVRQFIAVHEVVHDVLDLSPTPQSTIVDGYPILYRREPVSSSSRSVLVPTPYHGELGPVVKVPAVLGPVKRNGETIDPHRLRLEREHVNFPVANPDLLRLCTTRYLSFLFSLTERDEYDTRIYNFKESVAGVPGLTGFGPLPRSTSAAYPYVLKKPPTATGKWMFGHDENVTFDHPLALEVEEEVRAIVADARRGARREHIFIDTHKDELLKKAKVDACKTRVINNGPLALSIASRMYFGGFVRFIHNTRITNKIAIGVNPYSLEWSIIAKMFSQSQRKLAGDYSGFDFHMSAQFIEEFCWLVNQYYDDDNALIRNVLSAELKNAKHIVYDTVYESLGKNPSGNYLTATLNSVVNVIMSSYVHALVVSGKDAWSVDIKSFQESLETFYMNCSFICLGDDNMWGIDIDRPLAVEDYTKQYAMLGQVYTSADKVKENAFVEFDECTFLKRGFRYEPALRRWVAPLSLETILSTPCWTTRRDRNYTDLKESLYTMLKELSLHDSKTWDLWSPVMLKIAKSSLGYLPPVVDRKLLQQVVADEEQSL